MNPIEMVKLNTRIIRTYNSCNPTLFKELMDDVIIRHTDKEREFIFTSKFLIWNLIRPRDFYKLSAQWVTEQIADEELTLAERLLKLVLSTTKDESIRKSFIWNITKKSPLLTIDTIQYISAEKVHSLLTGEKEIVTDEYIRPILNEYQIVKNTVVALHDEIQTYQALIETQN